MRMSASLDVLTSAGDTRAAIYVSDLWMKIQEFKNKIGLTGFQNIVHGD